MKAQDQQIRISKIKDEAYAGTIEQSPETMASSHAIKRFFKSIGLVGVWLFRKVLGKLFIWRLLIEKPDGT